MMEVSRFVAGYKICHMALNQNIGLYALMSITKVPWGDISTDFALGLSRRCHRFDVAFVLINKFPKIAPFFLVRRAMI
jgi:hypothetical protein